MKHLLLVPVVALALAAATPAAAQCYADYKAKQDNPLQLHYGVVQLPDEACSSMGAATPEVADRIASGGWTLLNVVSLFGQDGLEERRDNAGEFFLRY